MQTDGKIQAKITLKLDPKNGDPEEMAEAIALLQKLGITPTGSLTMNMECDNEAHLEEICDRFDSAFFVCPDNVDATIETKIQRGVKRYTYTKPTPIEKAIRQDSEYD